MRDKTDEEIKTERAEIVKRVTERFGEVEVIDSFFTEDAPKEVNSGLWWLGKSLELLSTANCVYFAEAGRITEGVRLSMNVRYSMVLTL